MNEREKTRGGKHWGPRGASRPPPGRAAGALEGGRPRGAGRPGLPASSALPLACPAVLLRETSREESQPGLSTVPSAWALGSPRGCPPCPNQLGRRAGPSAASARTSIGWPLKAGVCPGCHPAPLREGSGPPAQGNPRRYKTLRDL